MTADPTAAGAAEATEAAGAGRAARNFRLGVLYGALYQAGEGFMDSNTVIPLFVSRLTASNGLVGLASALGDLGWLLPHPCGSQLNRRARKNGRSRSRGYRIARLRLQSPHGSPRPASQPASA